MADPVHTASTCQMFKSDTGDYVLYSDHEQEVERRAREEKLKAWEEGYLQREYLGWDEEFRQTNPYYEDTNHDKD